MLGYLIRRVIGLVFVLLVVSVLAFLLMNIEIAEPTLDDLYAHFLREHAA